MDGTMKIGWALACMVGTFIAGTRIQRYVDTAYLKGIAALMDVVDKKLDNNDDEKAEEESQ